MVKFAVGQAVKRVEDQSLITGRGRYTDDVSVANSAFGYVLRSPHAHARLVRVDKTKAEAAAGILAVLTGADVSAQGFGNIPCLVGVKNKDGTPPLETPRPILAIDRVRHVGEPVAFIVAESVDAAKDAAELIEVDYQPLAAITDARAATEDGAPRLYEHVPNNVTLDWETGDAAAVDAAFAKASRTVRVDLINNRVVVNSMEARVALAEYDPATDRTTLHLPSQGVHFVHGQIAQQVLKFDKAKLRCVTGNVGGSFGMKIFNYPELCLVVWASRMLKRAVKWTSERGEAFVSDNHGRDNITTAEMALDDTGLFLAIREITYANLGAFHSNFGPFVPTNTAVVAAGLYRTPAVHVVVKGVVTNTVPTDAYRGAGRPEGSYIVERLVDAIARELDVAPDEIRRRNFIAPEQMPYTTPLGDVYDSGEFAVAMESCMEKAGWAGFEARRAEAAARGRLRGVGMATYIERCGGAPAETASLEFGDDDSVTLVMGTQENGQGQETSYRQILSGELGIDSEAIRFVQGDSDRVSPGFTGGSRMGAVAGAAVLGAAQEVKEKARLIAANMLEAAPVDIEFDDGAFIVAGTDRSVSLFDVARAAHDDANLSEDMEPGLDDSFTRTPDAATYPNGCHIAEVEIDPETGNMEILAYTVVDDFGATINPLILAGQVHGGIVQGAGQALMEHAVYETESGQLVNGSFMDYAMPRADNFPAFEFGTHNVVCTTNPLGVKGAGEAGAIGAPPALVNAVVDAIRPSTGIAHIDMPLTPQKLWKTLNAG